LAILKAIPRLRAADGNAKAMAKAAGLAIPRAIPRPRAADGVKKASAPNVGARMKAPEAAAETSGNKH
jgi:hypothetical protein